MMSFNGPIDSMHLQTGTPYVTKLKTKILYRMDFILQCKSDEESLNGWRLLCGDGVAMVRLAMDDGELEKTKNPIMWKNLATKILEAWPPQTFEKTNQIRETGGYRLEYDHYCVEVETQDLPYAQRTLEKEKYNVIANKLMGIWGDCYSIAMVVGYLNLEEEIEIPVRMDDRYTSDRMRRGSQKWVTKDDGQRGDSQAPHVEGRGTSH